MSFWKFLFIEADKRPETPKALSDRTPKPTLILEDKKQQYDINDAFQMKLRKNKLKPQAMSKKQSADESSPEEVILNKACEALYSQVKKKIPQLETTFNMLDKLAKNIIDNPNDAKFKYVKLSNEKFAQNILKFKAAIQILEYYGFALGKNEFNDDWYVFPNFISMSSIKGKRLSAHKCMENYLSYKKMKRIT